MSPFFSSPPFHQNLQAIFAKHCMTTRHQHHIAWLGQTNDTEALLKTEISKLVEFPQILGFWFGFDKKGGVILQTQRLLTRIIQNLQNLLIHFKTKIPIFILHPILPPPKKKWNWSSSQCCTSLLESLERRSHWAAARALWKCRSRCPDFRCTERSTGLTTYKLGSLHSGSNPNILWTKPGNHGNTFTKHRLFCEKKLLWVSSCYTPRRLQSLFRFKVQSACHILFQDMIFFYHTWSRHPSSEKLSTQTITGIPLVSQASSCCPRHLIRLPTHLGI